MHDAAYRFVASAVRDLDLDQPGRWVVELGSYDVNGSVRDCFPQCAAYVGVDIRPGPGVDVVCDAATYQPDRRVDVVVTTEMLEHCPWPQRVIANALRMLAPGGVLLVTAASPSRPPHGRDGGALAADEHYGGIAPASLAAWLQPLVQAGGWCQVHTDPQAGDVYALAQRAGRRR